MNSGSPASSPMEGLQCSGCSEVGHEHVTFMGQCNGRINAVSPFHFSPEAIRASAQFTMPVLPAYASMASIEMEFSWPRLMVEKSGIP